MIRYRTLSISLYPLQIINKYLNSKKEKKPDPTRPVAINAPFFTEKRNEINNRRYQKKKQVDAGISVPLRYKQNEVANCSENYLARN